MERPWSRRQLDSYPGYLFPVYDPDTDMLVVSAKGSTSAYFMLLEENGISERLSFHWRANLWIVCFAKDGPQRYVM